MNRSTFTFEFDYPERLNKPVLHAIASVLLERWGGEPALQPAKERLGDGGPIGVLDYLNFLAAMDGMVLKPTIERLTARNYTWSREPEKVQVRSLKLYSPIETFANLPLENHSLADDIWNYLDEKPGTRSFLKRGLARQGEYQPQTGVVILRRLYDDVTMAQYGVDDGNAIVEGALLMGEQTINAYPS